MGHKANQLCPLFTLLLAGIVIAFKQQYGQCIEGISTPQATEEGPYKGQDGATQFCIRNRSTSTAFARFCHTSSCGTPLQKQLGGASQTTDHQDVWIDAAAAEMDRAMEMPEMWNESQGLHGLLWQMRNRLARASIQPTDSRDSSLASSGLVSKAEVPQEAEISARTGNGKGKGKSGKQGQPPVQGKGGNALRPLGLQSLPLPPKPPQPPSHGGSSALRPDPPAPADDVTQKTLDALMNALSRQDRATLPLEVQRVLDEKEAGDSKKLTKSLHQQTSKQGVARQELQAL